MNTTTEDLAKETQRFGKMCMAKASTQPDHQPDWTENKAEEYRHKHACILRPLDVDAIKTPEQALAALMEMDDGEKWTILTKTFADKSEKVITTIEAVRDQSYYDTKEQPNYLPKVRFFDGPDLQEVLRDAQQAFWKDYDAQLKVLLDMSEPGAENLREIAKELADEPRLKHLAERAIERARDMDELEEMDRERAKEDARERDEMERDYQTK
jgi:hypothetical protein